MVKSRGKGFCDGIQHASPQIEKTFCDGKENDFDKMGRTKEIVIKMESVNCNA